MLSKLPVGDKIEIAAITIVLLFCSTTVILAIAWANARDLTYFKERVILMEHRMNTLDKKQNDVNLRNESLIDKTNEVIKQTNDISIKQAEHDRWIEHWKSLPQLPKPVEQKKR